MVGFIITRQIQKALINGRMLLLPLEGKPVKINILKVYASTTDKSDAQIKQFYDDT